MSDDKNFTEQPELSLHEAELHEADEPRELDAISEIYHKDESSDSDDDSAPAPERKASSSETVEVVGVRFKQNGKIYYFAPNGISLSNGEHVVVDTSRGIEFGTVTMPNRNMKSSDVVLPIRAVIRRATDDDIARNKKNKELEINAFNTFIERIDEHGMEMKLIDVECAFDNSKLLFYFSAENRIDFRELVRELASIFHTRIELRQIGIRDEAKMLGGLGICGRPFCCSSFLSDFVQVSIKMAKEQSLSLNTAKISGACGRLMCCLRYEYDTYLAEKALTPKVGSSVMTPDGEGVVSDANPMTGIIKVKLCGTAEEDAPVLFVREDVIAKDKYKGEKLVRTRNPEKAKPNSLAGFEVVSPFSSADEAAEPKQREPLSPSENTAQKAERHDNSHKNRGSNDRVSVEKGTDPHPSNAPAGSAANENGGDSHEHSGNGKFHKRNRDRRRDKHSQGGAQQANTEQNAPQQKGEQRDKKPNRPEHAKSGNNRGAEQNKANQNDRHGNRPQQNGSQQPKNDTSRDSSQNNPGSEKKHNGGKHHRPFHHNRHKPRNGGGNGNGANGGGKAQ